MNIIRTYLPGPAFTLGLLLLAPAFLLTAGCKPPQDTATQNGSNGSDVVESKEPAYTLTVGDAEEFADLIAEQKGKVVLVDFWATWCGPCTDQFPHTVEMAEKYRDQGLSVVAVSFDDLSDPASEGKVRDFLDSVAADFPVMISDKDISDSLGDFDLAGSVPEYRLYDREGNLAIRFEPGVKPDEIEMAIREALKQENE